MKHLPWLVGGATLGYAARRARGRRLSVGEVRTCTETLVESAEAFAASPKAQKRMRTFKPGTLWHVQRGGRAAAATSFTACPQPPGTAGPAEESRIPRISFGPTPTKAWMASYMWGDSAKGRFWWIKGTPDFRWEGPWAGETVHVYTNAESVQAYVPTDKQVPDVWQTCEVWGLAPTPLTLAAVVDQRESAKLVGRGYGIYRNIQLQGSPDFRETFAQAPQEFIRLLGGWDYREGDELDRRFSYTAQAAWPHVETFVNEFFDGYSLPTSGGGCGLAGQRAAKHRGRRAESYPWLSLSKIKKYESLMRDRGVSKVARSPRGFLTAYKRAGTKVRLNPKWRMKRDGFIARHWTQAKKQARPLYETKGKWKGTPTRWHLALIAWGFSPDGAKAL
jgi:hypothetical protein